MGLFRKKHKKDTDSPTPKSQKVAQSTEKQSSMARLAFNSINDGVIILDKDNIIELINPAALRMAGCKSMEDAIGLDYRSIIKLENSEESVVDEDNNPIHLALKSGKEFESRDYILKTAQNRRLSVAIAITPTAGQFSDRIITFRDITRELKEEGEQAEFISTASHEMRTPVAAIEGYLGLAMNPQTATIDDRARQYLEEAHSASQHLGRLFQDLLDTTKLDDKKSKIRLVPVEMTSLVRGITSMQAPIMQSKKLHFSFGSPDDGARKIDQLVYGMVDIDFMQEIIGNLLENAVKYTPSGGSIWVGVRGDGDQTLINVTDTGMGIAPDDLEHIFQKFYRVDNSQTRVIGGTGLGLYLVRKRVEAMNGEVWAESAFGEGSTFYVSLPRLTSEEYERQRLVLTNQQAMHIARPSEHSDGHFSLGNPENDAPLPSSTPSAPLENTASASPEDSTPASSSAPPEDSGSAPSSIPSSTRKDSTSDPSEASDLVDLPTDKLDELKKRFGEQIRKQQDK